jgi:ParB/RepB/Spo0J family partition protein
MVLGRGLEDLLSNEDEAMTNDVPLSSIVANPNQPRKRFSDETIEELADSIKKQGLLQPIIVRPIESENQNTKYQIVVGERRFRAINSLGWKTIPTIIREDLDDKNAAIISLIENIQREEVDFWDQAVALRDLTDKYDMSVAEASSVLGRKKRWGYQVLKIFETPDKVQALVAAKKINGWTAAELSALSEEDPEKAIELAEALAEDASLRSTVLAYVKAVKNKVEDEDETLQQEGDESLDIEVIEEKPYIAPPLEDYEEETSNSSLKPSTNFADDNEYELEDEEPSKVNSEPVQREIRQLSDFDIVRIKSAAKDLTQIWGNLIEVEADGAFTGSIKFRFFDSNQFDELFGLLLKGPQQ